MIPKMMRFVRAAVVGGAVATAACSAPERRPTLPAGAARTELRIGTADGSRVTVRTVPLERYVEASILSEFAPAGGDPRVVERMFEIQAIIGRTYAAAHPGRHAQDGYDLCDRTHCQLYQPGRLATSRWAPQAAAAVRRTAGQILSFADAPALVVYHADCGGRTSAATDVWGGAAPPYLVGRADDGAAARAHGTWTYAVRTSALHAALNADPRTRVGARFDAIRILDRDAAGRVERVAIQGSQERTVRGEILRSVLGAAFGARSVRSTWFSVERGDDTVIFTGRGFGHGVGLCQAGALARLQGGAGVSGILRRYFPGTRLSALAG